MSTGTTLIKAGVALLLVPGAAAAQANEDWAFVPDFAFPVSAFWGQFWSIVNWLSGFIFPILGLAVGTAALTFVIKRTFFTGAN